MSRQTLFGDHHFAYQKACQWLTICGCALSMVIFLNFNISHAADFSEVTKKVNSYLASGEFTPAIRLAQQVTNNPQRDDLLAKISQAQRTAGALRAAVRTSSLIQNDASRYHSVQQVSELSKPIGASGGDQFEFDSLMDLIMSTVSPESWQENGEGEGTISPFVGGVYVDSQAVMRRILKREPTRQLEKLLEKVNPQEAEFGSVRSYNPLRKISLTRLEKALHQQLATGKKPTQSMRNLAGLEKIQYIFVYPKTGDIVIAGPAGDWTTNNEEQMVSRKTGRPIILLEDLIEIFQQVNQSKNGRFGCSITPRKKALAETRAFLEESAKRKINPTRRKQWLKQLRDTMGQQTIDIYGINPRSHVGRTMVEADYRMKLVGMGLEEGVVGVNSYLSQVRIPKGKAPPPMSVLRWWFTLNYDSVMATESNRGFQFHGAGVQVLSENEMLKATGERVHTGKSDPLTQKFAHSFTKHFPELSKKYPVYAQLHNLFDLAMVATLIKQEKLHEQVGWEMIYFQQKQKLPAGQPAPATVETVINHRVINKKHIIAGVSGGVTVEPQKWFKNHKVQIETNRVIAVRHQSAAPTNKDFENWWWD